MKEINRNFPWCDEYDESAFTGSLNEQEIWDDTQYFLLDREIYRLVREYGDSENIPRVLAWRVMRIFSYSMLIIGCHFDENDKFKFKNLNSEELFDRRERLQIVFEGFFKGVMPNDKSFSYREEP